LPPDICARDFKAPISVAEIAGVWPWACVIAHSEEGSLDGGLHCSLSGGSFQTFRDQFSWSVLPSVADFTSAVQSAFGAWTLVDPATQLDTTLSFVFDQNTVVQGVAGGGVNTNGAEIDLIATNDASFWNPRSTGLQGETWFNGINAPVTLTSGVANYANSRAISGADLYINNNPGALYDLDTFRRLLTHELGHAPGFGDVEAEINQGTFIDDNFDGTSNATKVATLDNSWALLVDPFDPSGSAGLALYDIGGGASSIPGVDLLMESWGLGISGGNPVTDLSPLTKDEYGIRQFLYPFVQVPEPGTLVLLSLGLAGFAASRRRKH
jgi:hypothetical protein